MRNIFHATTAIVTTLVALIFIPASFADDTTTNTTTPPASQPAPRQPQTKLEGFMGSKGTLYIRDIVECGTIDAVTVEAVTLYKPGHEEEKTRGFILSASNAFSAVTVYVDYDEGTSLIQALTYMQGLSAKWRGLNQNYKEADYLTTGGLKVMFYHTADGKHQDAKVYLTDGVTLNTDMKDTEFAAFKDMIVAGEAWLDKQ